MTLADGFGETNLADVVSVLVRVVEAAGPPSWSAVDAAALTIVIRQLAGRALTAAEGAPSIDFGPCATPSPRSPSTRPRR